MDVSRKRLRSDENEFGLQLKYFVNQKLVDRNDEDKMKKIYEKTLRLMFTAAKSQRKSADKKQSDVLDTEDKNSSIIDVLDDDKPQNNTLSLSCKLCLNNNVDPLSAKMCKNCNLLSCEKCQKTCSYCSNALCVNCVVIFGCQYDSLPICEDCKILL